jgi:hypothetical protein
MGMKKFLLVLLFLLTACNAAPTETTPSSLRVEYTAAARPWLAALQDCAAGQNATLLLEPRSADFFDPSSDMAMRIGEPAAFPGFAYQIGEEEIVLVVHPQNPAALLDRATARRLFAGQVANWQELGGPDLPVQVWVYAAGEDVQQAFDAAILQGTPAVSTARLATSIEEMAAGIGSDPAAVGLLPAGQVPETVRTLHLNAPLLVPVIALTGAEPEGALAGILACLQDQ